MYKKIFLLLNVLFLSYGLFSQYSPSKKELKLYHKIYGIALDSFLHSRPSHFILVDSTDNRQIQEFNFSEHVNYLRLANDSKLDSSWLRFLKEADINKTALQKIGLKQIKSIHTIRLFNRDTLFKILKENHDVGKTIVNPYGWIDGVMTVSTPIVSKKRDKAVVEISYTRDELDGNGGILLLEKRKDGSWVVVQYLRTWIS